SAPSGAAPSSEATVWSKPSMTSPPAEVSREVCIRRRATPSEGRGPPPEPWRAPFCEVREPPPRPPGFLDEAFLPEDSLPAAFLPAALRGPALRGCAFRVPLPRVLPSRVTPPPRPPPP